MEEAPLTHFFVVVCGQIESIMFDGPPNLYARFSYVHGPDWEVVKVNKETVSLEEGITQVSDRKPGAQPLFVLNFPLEITFRSTNPFGWPQIVITLYSLDGKGNETIQGYGSVHLPWAPGRYDKYVDLFSPVASSPIQGIIASVSGSKPEFVDPTFVARGSGREVTRVTSQGTVKFVFDVITQHLGSFGFADATVVADRKQ